MLGILREDSLLVPFGYFDGQFWSNPWPVIDGNEMVDPPRRLVDVPVAWWGGGPPILRWELLAVPNTLRSVTVTGTGVFNNHCSTGIGLKTDHVSRLAFPTSGYPVADAGIVSTVPGLLTPVSRLTETDADFAAVQGLLSDIFDRLEPDVWGRARNAEIKGALGGAPDRPILHRAFRGQLPDGRELVTFFATRGLWVKGAIDGPATTVVGWLARTWDSPLRSILVEGSQSDMDGKGGGEMFIPMASLSVAGRTFWVGSSHGYESESNDVVEVGLRVPISRLATGAGGC